MMGTERRSLVMSEAEKRMTAYHEGGHALCAMHEPECDPVHKATIIPRGRALGLVMSLPEGDRYSKSKSKLLAELTMAMGGRAAEEIIFGPDKVSNGAAGDIKMATDQARRMITEWGMSDKLGMIAYGDNSQEVFLGHSVTQNKNVSEATAREIDAEIKDIIDRAYAKARRILTENVEELHRLARGLLEHETLSGDEIRTVLRGEPVIRKVVDEPAPESRRASVPTAGRPAAPTPPAGRPGTGAAAGLIAGTGPAPEQALWLKVPGGLAIGRGAAIITAVHTELRHDRRIHRHDPPSARLGDPSARAGVLFDRGYMRDFAQAAEAAASTACWSDTSPMARTGFCSPRTPRRIPNVWASCSRIGPASSRRPWRRASSPRSIRSPAVARRSM